MIQHQNQMQRFFIPFNWPSLDHKRRIVRGVSPSQMEGNRWNISPTAIKRAAGDSMAMPPLRAMHGIAAGRGLSVEFDAEGRLVLEAQIVERNEWEKVLAQVYRGFLIGGRPQLVRGSNIDKFDWQELTLADRPEFRDEICRASSPLDLTERRRTLTDERRKILLETPDTTGEKAVRLASIDMALAKRF